MPNRLAQLLNKPIFVVTPALFGDEQPRECILVEIESAGLWLRAPELWDRFGRSHAVVPDAATALTLFVPFQNILYLFSATQFAALAMAEVVPADEPQRATRPRAARQTRRPTGRTEPKGRTPRPRR